MDIWKYFGFCLSEVVYFGLILCVLNHYIILVQIKNITGTVFCKKETMVATGTWPQLVLCQ